METVDSVTVSVPIERRIFEGDGYRVTASGFNVAVEDVLLKYPAVTRTRTETVRRRWGFTLGVQAGYGITAGGWSPYAGLGFTFGYTF